jgi:hypothetical protein
MALANVACVLAGRGYRVLAIDWDLEAPGLHAFFQRYLGSAGATLAQQPGLIDLMWKTREMAARLGAGRLGAEDIPADLIHECGALESVHSTSIQGLSLLTAGRFDDNYSQQVSTFDWQEYFSSCPDILPALMTQLGAHFDYILVDSRTGVTDAGAICTGVVPDKLVVVFTPARQSLEGGVRVAEHAINNRRRSSDLRPLDVYPLPSRVEVSMEELRNHWRFGKAPLVGYQVMFEDLFERAYGDRVDLGSYFNEVQIPHVPYYSYGEEVAVLLEQPGDRFSLAAIFSRFTDYLESPADIGSYEA